MEPRTRRFNGTQTRMNKRWKIELLFHAHFKSDIYEAITVVTFPNDNNNMNIIRIVQIKYFIQ